MDIGAPRRQLSFDELQAHLPDPLQEDKRTQCSLCCALRVSAVVFAGSSLVSLPFNAVAHGFGGASPAQRKTFTHPLSKVDASAASVKSSKFVTTDGGGLYVRAAAEGGMDAFLGGHQRAAPSNPMGTIPTRAPTAAPIQQSGAARRLTFIADRYLFHSLPLAAVTFTHQYILSHLMWSKSEKSLFTANVQSVAANACIWMGMALAGRIFHRRVIIPRSSAARIDHFENERRIRIKGNRYQPVLSGQLSQHFGVNQVAWVLCVHSLFWMVAALANEHLSMNHYSMFHGLIPAYSTHCAPRWREWRENELRRRRLVKDNEKAIRSMGEGRDDRMWGASRSSRTPRPE